MKPVSKTAFYCCGIRMLDAEAPQPVCGDTLAACFMDEEARRFLEEFRDFPNPNASNVARHRLMDDLLREALRCDAALRIVVIGAGFDTRPYRLSGGRWLELDEPEILAFKEARLPASEAPNELARIPIDFATESLAEKLAPYAGEGPAVIVLEGVAVYLAEPELRSLARTVRTCLPQAMVIADLMTWSFYRRYSQALQARLQQFGAAFRLGKRHPVDVFRSEGFRVQGQHSIVERAIEAGTIGVPWWFFRWFLGTLREGYAVWVLEPVN